MADLLMNRGEDIVARWVRLDESTFEQKMIADKMKQLKDPKKIKLLNDMLDTLLSGGNG